MLVKELKKMLKELPPNMEVVVINGDILFSGCRAESRIIEAIIDDKEQEAFLIAPCTCGESSEFNLN